MIAILIIIIIIISSFCNAWLINPLGSLSAAVWQPQRTHRLFNLRQTSRFCIHTTRDQKLWTRNMKEFRFLGVGGNWSARRKPTKAGMESANQIHIQHWLAALVKGKCSSTKPTRLATGVVCHPDTEQNRPYKIHWPCRGLNRGPTVPQARTLPVCHTTPHYSNFKLSK